MQRVLEILVLIACLLLTASCQAPSSRGLTQGEKLPAIELSSLDGKVVALEALRGKPMILNFWATWCGPCRYEIPTLKKIANASDDFVVLGIALDDAGASVVRPYVEREGIDYPILLGSRQLLLDLGANAIPYTVILDADHTVIRVHRGVVSERTLERDLQRLRS